MHLCYKLISCHLKYFVFLVKGIIQVFMPGRIQSTAVNVEVNLNLPNYCTCFVFGPNLVRWSCSQLFLEICNSFAQQVVFELQFSFGVWISHWSCVTGRGCWSCGCITACHASWHFVAKTFLNAHNLAQVKRDQCHQCAEHQHCICHDEHDKGVGDGCTKPLVSKTFVEYHVWQVS